MAATILATPTDLPTAAVLEAGHAHAERIINRVRGIVLGALALAAAVYAPRLTPGLTTVNLAVLAPMIAWTTAQYFAFHRRRRFPRWLSTANAVIDISAVSAVLVGYGFVGGSDLAVKSPIWVAYFIILAARPFTTSMPRAVVAAGLVVAEYAALVALLAWRGGLEFRDGPLAAVSAPGTSLIDEGAKLLLLGIAGAVGAYATAWAERMLRRTGAALRASEAELRAVIEAMSDVILVLDRDGRYLKIAPSGADRLYRAPRELLGRRLHDVLPVERAEAFLALVRRGLEGGQPAELEYTLEIAGRPMWFIATVTRLTDDAVVFVARDITHRKATEEALRASEARFRAIFDHSAVGIVLVGLDGAIIDANAAFQQYLGYGAEELRGRTSGERSPPEDAETTRALVREIVAGIRESGTIEKRYIRRDGQTVWATLTISRAAAAGCLIGLVQDVTERKALEEQLIHQAFHDPLTGLANRALLRDRVEHALARADRQRDRVTVLFLDIDEFKTVNDTIGHGEGDRLLQTIAARLLNATRGCDTVARLGGDEFAVLLESVPGDDDAVVIAERVITALRAPMAPHGPAAGIGASIGIASAGPDDGAEELLRNADLAMYRAKARGKGRWEVYAPAMHAELVDRLALEADLRAALERGELRLAYQPIVELATGQLTGLEALVRWQHPTRGLLAPGAFIGVAEETGLIVPLGRWVLREACRRAAAWQRRRPAERPLTITVNLSGRQLEDPSIADDVAAALRESGLHPANLVLEITENVIMGDGLVTHARLSDLKALGVHLAIDDFGTGYSSLSYLQRFPVDVLKIDKTFVDDVTRGGNAAALARTIIALGDLLSLRTVAEGIEVAEQRTLLRSLGCELGQGFLFARPLSPDEAEVIVAAGRVDLARSASLPITAAS